jgi:hypothetical protein
VEIGGFTGEHMWLIVAVMLFNLVCIFLWFIIGALRRVQGGALKEARTFIELMRREATEQKLSRSRAEQLEAALVEVEKQLQDGEDKGPLWGRRTVTSANMQLHGVSDRFREVSDPVNEQMAGKR